MLLYPVYQFAKQIGLLGRTHVNPKVESYLDEVIITRQSFRIHCFEPLPRQLRNSPALPV